MLSTKGLEFSYTNGDAMVFPDIHLESKSNLLVLGPSGCGKTTLLHLICGFLNPQKGSIHINNENFGALSVSKKDAFRGKHIGVVFQQAKHFSGMNCLEHLEYASYFSGRKNKSDENRQLLNQLGLEASLKQQASSLSQGQLQRLNIAMALINKPLLILADEPTAALDDTNCERVIELLKEQAQATEAALLIITHDQRLKSQFQNQLSL